VLIFFREIPELIYSFVYRDPFVSLFREWSSLFGMIRGVACLGGRPAVILFMPETFWWNRWVVSSMWDEESVVTRGLRTMQIRRYSINRNHSLHEANNWESFLACHMCVCVWDMKLSRAEVKSENVGVPIMPLIRIGKCPFLISAGASGCSWLRFFVIFLSPYRHLPG
jgi:hypothetical protein